MSNIPEARRIIEELLTWALDDHVSDSLNSVLSLLHRKKPEFVSPRKLSPLSDSDIHWARILRKQGMPMNIIASKLKTNIGRVSEAINGRPQ